MAGIYIHIPFCRKACYYCNFHFSTSLQRVDEMMQAIEKELLMRQNYLSETIDTIYFGGGTPSLVDTNAIKQLLTQIKNTYNVSSSVEITLEANPEDIDARKADDLITLGINRISLGIQSFEDDILQSLNRSHNSIQAINAIQQLHNSGFSNITLDLIYGIPAQSTEMWNNNLAQAIDFGIQHLSCYALTIEEKTAFGHWQRQGVFTPVAENHYENDYKSMCRILREAGYNHYEVSNFALPGFESRHNSAYWQHQAYLGLGPGAHSYNYTGRTFNISNNASYIKGIKKGEQPNQTETLTTSQRFNEYLLTGLRTNQGIDLTSIKKEFGVNLLKQKKYFIDQCLNNDRAILKNNRFIITENALILADSIILELMMDEL